MTRFILSPNHNLAGIRDKNLKQLKRVRVKIQSEQAIEQKLSKTQMLKSCPVYQEKVRLKTAKAKATREANKRESERLERLKILENERLLAERQANQIMFNNNC